MVFLEMTMSVDGFVAAPAISLRNPLGIGGLRLHEWLLSSTDVERDLAGDMFAGTGAFVIGRRTYDVGEEPWGEELGVPCFVVTHWALEPVAKGATTFTFVEEGVEAAIELAREAAGDRDVCVMGGADVAQQALAAGLVDELRIHVAPLLLVDGTRLFEHHGTEPVELERTAVVETPHATHLTFRVARLAEA